jgi:hypothetical protein
MEDQNKKQENEQVPSELTDTQLDEAAGGLLPAYPGFQGGVRVAVGDVNGDSTPEVITSAGPGGGPHVKAFDGSSTK